MNDRQGKIGTWGLIVFITLILAGNMYGLYHDFTEEYEASVPIVYEIDHENIHNNGIPAIIDGKIVYGQHGKDRNFKIEGGMVIATTTLNSADMKIQDEQGCIPCHPK